MIDTGHWLVSPSVSVETSCKAFLLLPRYICRKPQRSPRRDIASLIFYFSVSKLTVDTESRRHVLINFPIGWIIGLSEQPEWVARNTFEICIHYERNFELILSIVKLQDRTTFRHLYFYCIVIRTKFEMSVSTLRRVEIPGGSLCRNAEIHHV